MLKRIREFFRKQSRVSQLLVGLNAGQPVWTPVRYDKLANEGFTKNTYVFRCVQLIAMACGGIPWLLYRRRGGLRELESHPLLDLLARPNPQQGQARFIETVVAYLQLAGNSYIERVGPKNGPPKELYVLRPDRIKIIKGTAIQPVAGYEYEVDGMKKRIPAEWVLHLKTFHPLDDWYGLSPIEAAARSIDQNNESKAWNVALLQNGARPSGALVYQGNLMDEQFRRLKQQLEEQYQSAKNAGRALVLDGGLDWKEMSLSPVDMAWLEGLKLSAREIAIAFGVPPELIGDSTNKTYSNYREARQAFYMETILPLMDCLRDELNNWLTPMFGDNLYLDYDRDEIEALQEDREAVWDRVLKAVNAGILTVNEAREVMGYEALPDGDRLQNENPNPVSEEPSEESPKAIEWKAFNLQSNEQKTAYWKAFDQLRVSWEKAVQNQVAKQFRQEARQIRKALTLLTNVNDIESVVHENIDQSAWEKLYQAIYVGIMEDFGERILQGLKSSSYLQSKQRKQSLKQDSDQPQLPPEVFDIWLDEALEFVRATVGERVKQVTDTTKKQIKEAVAEGLIRGESMDEIADRIDALYLEEIIPRSETIARTEVIAASSAGSRYAAKATGLPLKKEWLATRDKRTRPSHRLLDGQIRGIDEPYSNGLMFPGDPTGPPHEVIRCRCAEVYHVIEGGEEE